MAKNRNVLIALRGTDEYGEFLDRLYAAVRESGVDLESDSRTALAEHAFAELAAEYGLTPPRRVNPFGANQHGNPASP